MTYALVTGATGGIGKAIALELARRGARLALTDLRLEDLEPLADACGGASVFACDLTDHAQVTSLFEDLGELPDVVVNSIGKGYMGDFASVSPGDFERSFAVNFFAPLFVSLAAYRRWRDAKVEGRLLNLSSISGHRAYSSSIAYGAAKHALESASTILRGEGAPHGIAVGTLCPTNTATGFWTNAEYAEGLQAPAENRMISAGEVATEALKWLDGPERPASVFVPPEIGENATVYGVEDATETAQWFDVLAHAGHTYPSSPGVAVVTGASAGMGLELAKRLASAGWKVVGMARNRDRLEAQLTAQGGPLHSVYATDVGDAARVARALDATVQELGSIDLLVNNAGATKIGWPHLFPDGDIKRIFDTNFYGYYHPTRAAIPHLTKTRGTILNVLSITAQQPARVALPYSCAKVAQAVLSDRLREDLAWDGIRVIDVFPGNTQTEFFDRAESVDGLPVTTPANAMPVAEVADRMMAAIVEQRTTDTIV